jgi:hypothetical protein
MATVSKFTRGAVSGNGWTNAANATGDDGSYSTCAPAKNATISGDWDFAAFSDAELPVGATINSVTLEFQFKVSTTSSVATFHYGTVDSVGTLSDSTDATEPTADKIVTTSTWDTAPTESNLKTAGSLKARAQGQRGNSNNAVTFSLDYVTITVDYTTTSIVEGDGSSSGVGATDVDGAAVWNSASASDGIASSSVVGAAVAVSDYSSVGAAASSVGAAAIFAGIYSSAGTSTAQADNISSGPVEADGASAGVGLSSVVGASLFTGVFGSDGVATSSVATAAIAGGAFSSDGVATPSALAAFFSLSEFSSAGLGGSSVTGAALFAALYSSSGSATVSGEPYTGGLTEADALSTASSTASVTAAALWQAGFESPGSSQSSVAGAALALAVMAASGVAVVDADGESYTSVINTDHLFTLVTAANRESFTDHVGSGNFTRKVS